jgi:hypothetical protein
MVTMFRASCAGVDEPTARICLARAGWDAPLAIEAWTRSRGNAWKREPPVLEEGVPEEAEHCALQ